MSTERDLRVIVIGAGMAGIASAIKLLEAGIDDLCIYEKADRVGGTWRENTYPGIACDVPSHLYSYSFEPNPEWSHLFSPGDEIQRYFEEVAAKHRIEEITRFGEEVTHLEHRDGRWHLRTASGIEDRADVVIAATGVLHHPRMPDLPGLDRFEGDAFHSARWDHSVDLDGARVGVVGTGSSAVQIVSAVVDRVAHLSLFQRTAQWILPMDNPPYPEEDMARFRQEPELLHHIHDAFAQTFAAGFANAVVDADSPQMAALEAACLENLERVTDPGLRERLRPDHRAACKRLVVSPDFYEAIQRPHAELVTERIDAVEPSGVRTADGRLHELDVLVLATGFRVDRFLRPIEVTGRDGVRLDDVWAQRPSAYLSVSVPGFPNLFMLNGPNGPVGNFSLIEVAELQLAYLMPLIEGIRSGHWREVSASAEATRDFDEARTEAAKTTIWATGCNSWYLDDRGIPAAWPWTFDRFREEMSEPRLADFEVVT
jgi:cation diffusion facilitator CzcD-associated flavoprotein CzcO